MSRACRSVHSEPFIFVIRKARLVFRVIAVAAYITSMRPAPAARSPVPVNPACVQLTKADISEALGLSSSAGWNQTHEDWRLLLELSDACFGIRIDGQVVATATLVCYGQTLAWVGMVVTRPEFRR